MLTSTGRIFVCRHVYKQQENTHSCNDQSLAFRSTLDGAIVVRALARAFRDVDLLE